MPEKSWRDREISRREAEKMRAELIVDEMASAVRLLGGNGPALEQNNRAACAARLPITVVERLRWKKIKRIPADVADAVREALHRNNEESLARAKHELTVERQRSAALLAYLEAGDADFYRPEIDRLRREASVGGREAAQVGGDFA